MRKNVHLPIVFVVLLLLTSCGSEEPEVPVVTAFDDTYFGMCRGRGEDIAAVWDFTIQDGVIIGSTTVVRERMARKWAFSSTVRASGAFDIMVEYTDGVTGTIEGLVKANGEITGSWRDSNGPNGPIVGKKLDKEFETYNGSYAGSTDSDLDWSFQVANNVVEGRLNDIPFAALIGLQGQTIKLVSGRFMINGENIRVEFAISESGTVGGTWQNLDNPEHSGEVSGTKSGN